MNTLHSFDEVFDTQAVFRKVLEAMSNPARTVSIAEQKSRLFGEYEEFIALAVTLLDNEVTFSGCGNEELERDIQLVTLSEQADISNADFIFVSDLKMLPDIFEKAKCGTLTDPHKSAVLIIKNNKNHDNIMELYGPGIDGTLKFSCSDIIYNSISLRDKCEYEYPTGIDMIFVTESGEVACIPRLVKRRSS